MSVIAKSRQGEFLTDVMADISTKHEDFILSD
jgi:hypothetical protein